MVFGGDFKNTDNTPAQSGLFTRREVNEPNGMPKATRGFRCVGLAGNPEMGRILPDPGTGTTPPRTGARAPRTRRATWTRA